MERLELLQFKIAENGRTQAMGQYEMRKCKGLKLLQFTTVGNVRTQTMGQFKTIKWKVSGCYTTRLLRIAGLKFQDNLRQFRTKKLKDSSYTTI